MTGRFVFRAVKALVRVTLSDSSRIRPHRIYRAPGMPDLATKWVVLWQVKFCAFGQKKPGWIVRTSGTSAPTAVTWYVIVRLWPACALGCACEVVKSDDGP